MKRGQIQIIFTWIFILVLASLILIYGIQTVKKTQELGNEAVVINFFKSFSSRVNTYYYLSTESSGIEEFNLPSDIKCICFTKDSSLNNINNVECGKDKEILLDNLKEYSNIFLFSDKSYQQDRMNISFLNPSKNPVCVSVDNGLLRLKLENIGLDGVDVQNP